MFELSRKKVIDEENLKIGNMLQKARKQRKVLQKDLCEETGLTENHISAVERGVCKASVRVLLAYCNKLKMTPNDILEYREEEILPELKKNLQEMDTLKQREILEILKIITMYAKVWK